MKRMKVLASLFFALLLVFQCAAVAEPGWVEKDGFRCLYSDQDTPVSGWYLENGSWYRLTEEGALITGIFNKGDDAYRTDEEGRIAEGWKKIENVWYLLTYSGEDAAGANRLRFVDSRDKKSGTELPANSETVTTESDSSLLTGWIPSEEEKTFYFNEDGTCDIGWKKIGENLYFFTPDGLSTADKVFIDGEFYAFENGILKDSEAKMAKALSQAVLHEVPVMDPLATPTDLEAETKEEIPEVIVSLVTINEAIPFETEYRKDNNRYEDEKSIVLRKGADGVKSSVYEVTTDKEGKEISRVLKSESVTEPVKQIISIPKKPHVYEETETTVEEAIPFTTEIQNDVSRVKGEPDKVVQEGKDGVKQKVYTVFLTDGVETGRVMKSESVTKEPVKKIVNVAIGDKVDVVITYKTVIESIPYEVKNEPTEELPKGETVVVQKGVNGEKETVYEIKSDLDGKEISRTVVTEKVLKTPTTEIVKTGTKEVTPTEVPPVGFQD